MKRLGWVLLAMLMMTLPLAAQQFGTVTGMVTFEDGNPIARAEVRILTGDHGPMHGLRTFTNPEGIYFFPRVPVGEFEMHAGLFRGPEAEATVVVTENEESVVDFVLAGDDGGDDLVFGSVSGTVASVDGEALAGAVVTITVADDRNHPRNLVNRTDDAGAFSFDEVPVGEWAIHAGFHGFARFEGTVAVLEGENTVMDIVLEAWDGGDDDLVFGSVVGTVGDVDGAGIAGAIVSINIQNDNDRHPRRRHIETRTDEFGAFAFEQVPVGEWGIVVFARDFQQFRGIVEVLENEETTVDVVLEAWDGGDFETGAVFGNVTDIDGLPVELARISLRRDNDNPGDPGRRGRHHRLDALTDVDGNYVIENAPVGNYIAIAGKRGFVRAEQAVEVVLDGQTEANFILEAGEDRGGDDGRRGGRDRHPGEPIDLAGFAIVVVDDNGLTTYFIDIDNDGAEDYMLNFGPADYTPDNGAVRPEEGDEIEIHGMLVGNTEPQMVVVLTINGLDWRVAPDHGGRRGGGDGWDNWTDPVLVEAEGFALVREGEWHNCYALDIDEDEAADYGLFFGEPEYDPGNGAERPMAGDFVTIVGGEITHPDRMPIIIVYQINGMIWREPGDTTGLAWVADENYVAGETSALPVTATLLKTYPNPFNPTTTVSVGLPIAGQTSVKLFDLMGREIVTLHNGYMQAGTQRFQLDGSRLAAGTYFLRFDTPSTSLTRKVTLVK